MNSTSLTRSGLSLGLAALVGAVSGVAGARLTTAAPAAATTERVIEYRPIEVVSVRDGGGYPDRPGPALVPPPGEVAEVEGATDTPLDRVQMARARDERIQAQFARIRAEPVDPTWAWRARSAITPGTEAVASAAGARLVEMDCRSSGCVSTLEWPDYHTAVQRFRTVLSAPTDSLQCTRTIPLPPPSDPTAPYQATMLYDCGDPGAVR